MNNQIAQAATVIEVHPKHSLVKVNDLGKPSAWLPVLQQANSFKRNFVSPQIGEQVVVLAGLYVLGAIYNQQCKEPAHGANTDITEYKDGTKISYDADKKQLSINTPSDISIKTTANASFNCKTANIKADNCKIKSTNTEIKANQATIDATDINLGKGGAGVLTGQCIDSFTGAPYASLSATVKAAI